MEANKHQISDFEFQATQRVKINFIEDDERATDDQRSNERES